jgi:hypothetical protein
VTARATAVLGLLLVCLIGAGAGPTGVAAAGGRSSCGSYFELGESLGEVHRIAISPSGVRCGAAMDVVRSFRSLLPKRHHGGAGTKGWWTLIDSPGWRCGKTASGGSCRRRHATVDYTVRPSFPKRRCQVNVPIYHGAAGVLILSWRHLSCGKRHAIAKGAIHSYGHRFHDRGFTCRRLNLRAGGGGVICRRGARFVELGFE